MDPQPARGLDADLRQRLAAIELVVLDVDGVLTDGGVVYVDGEEAQRFDVKDGAGLAWLRREGVHQAWITGRGCDATRRRAEELGALLHTGVRGKEEVLAQVQRDLGVSPEATLAMGDDLPDLALAARAAVFVAPADARPEVRARADLVTRARGGRGAVRELAEALLDARGRWQSIVDGAGG